MLLNSSYNCYSVPVFKKGTVIGYYENIMRYSLSSLQGAGSCNRMIFLEALKKFKQEGAQFISLGLSPLHDLDNSPYNDNVELKEFSKSMYNKSKFYAFRGTGRHKEKYPALIKHDVFFACQPSTTIEGIFNVFKAVGVFKSIE